MTKKRHEKAEEETGIETPEIKEPVKENKLPLTKGNIYRR